MFCFSLWYHPTQTNLLKNKNLYFNSSVSLTISSMMHILRYIWCIYNIYIQNPDILNVSYYIYMHIRLSTSNIFPYLFFVALHTKLHYDDINIYLSIFFLFYFFYYFWACSSSLILFNNLINISKYLEKLKSRYFNFKSRFWNIYFIVIKKT